MIANWGWDPLWSASMVGLIVGVLWAFTPRWGSWWQRQATYGLVLAVLVVLSWGFTSFPWIWGLVFTMLAVAYGIAQFIVVSVSAISGEKP